MSSKPYIKKMNLAADKAQWTAWEMHFRTGEYDIFVSVVRRKFIPPLMDIFEDIICYSTVKTFDENKQIGDMAKIEDFQIQTHQTAIDSIFPEMRYTKFYKNIITEKSNSLLMDEDTMNFYHYNLNIAPTGIEYAVHYMTSILNILGKQNGEICKDL